MVKKSHSLPLSHHRGLKVGSKIHFQGFPLCLNFALRKYKQPKAWGLGNWEHHCLGTKTGSKQKDQQHLHCSPVLGEQAAPWDMSALGTSLEEQGTKEPPRVEHIQEKRVENHSLTPPAAERGILRIFSILLQ